MRDGAGLEINDLVAVNLSNGLYVYLGDRWVAFVSRAPMPVTDFFYIEHVHKNELKEVVWAREDNNFGKCESCKMSPPEHLVARAAFLAKLR